MIQRGKEPGFGLWTIPGGRVEFGETLEEACQREVKEETGIDVLVGEMVTVFEPIVQNYHYVIIDYLGILRADTSQPPQAGDDASDARWVALDKLAELPLTTNLLLVVTKALALARANGTLEEAGGDF